MNHSLALFEKASVCKLHRDPLNKKCKFLPLGRWRNTLQQTDIPCDYMTLSDHLDMVGVTLMASWVKTRKANGDTLQLKIKNTVNPWKAGKFLPITQRGWSLNCYALSKVWFKAKSVDLRVCDIQSITSSCKSWLYQDMLAKPEEMILHRPASYGGLGLQHIKYKSMAGFISTFLQTAANPAFQSNLLHTLLYRKYVLEEDDVPGAPAKLPPYLPLELFTIIRKVKTDTPLNVVTMSERDWSRLLTEDHVTMRVNPDSGVREFLPSRAEQTSPATDWELSWLLCRQQGLPPELSSFLWKLLLNLLCPQEKLHRMGVSPSPLCRLCKTETGTLTHELLDCSHNANIGQELLNSLQHHIPTLSADSLLHLGFPNLEAKMQLPITILTAVTLQCIWKERSTSSRVRAYQVRSELEQTIAMLRTTRLATAADILSNILEPMFH